MSDAGPSPDALAASDASIDATGADTIVAIAAANPDFSILVSALQRTGLDTVLQGEGPFTVFAPVNAAFDGIDVSAISDEDLTQILSNHVIIGAAVGSEAIPATADNAAELTLLFDTSAGVSVNGATVTAADVDASNGVIHIIDSVIMPATIGDLAGYAGLSSLADALVSAELLGAVTDPSADLTVFAPTNEAFTAAGEVPADALANILLYHVVGASVESADVPAMAPTLATNEWGNNLTLLFNTDSGVTINGGPSVALADIRATNGIVHVIDGVLLPMNIVDAATAAGLTELTGAVGAAAEIEAGVSVADALVGDGPLTVFAPTNAAFEAISETVAGLSAEQTRDVLLYHVVGGAAPVLSTDLSDGDVPTLAGQSVTVDTAGPTVNGEEIAVADINVSNGVVHVIGGVLIPTFD